MVYDFISGQYRYSAIDFGSAIKLKDLFDTEDFVLVEYLYPASSVKVSELRQVSQNGVPLITFEKYQQNSDSKLSEFAAVNFVGDIKAGESKSIRLIRTVDGCFGTAKSGGIPTDADADVFVLKVNDEKDICAVDLSDIDGVYNDDNDSLSFYNVSFPTKLAEYTYGTRCLTVYAPFSCIKSMRDYFDYVCSVDLDKQRLPIILKVNGRRLGNFGSLTYAKAQLEKQLLKDKDAFYSVYLGTNERNALVRIVKSDKLWIQCNCRTQDDQVLAMFDWFDTLCTEKS